MGYRLQIDTMYTSFRSHFCLVKTCQRVAAFGLPIGQDVLRDMGFESPFFPAHPSPASRHQHDTGCEPT